MTTQLVPHLQLSRAVLVVTLCTVSVVLGGCDKSHMANNPSPVTACSGNSCLSWTGNVQSFCQSYTGSKQNEAYQASPRIYSYTLPITAFFKVIQRDPNGVDVFTTGEQTVSVGSSSGQVLPICHAATVNGEILTQRLQLTCVTNRQLANGATSANCNAQELTSAVVEIDIGVRKAFTRRDTEKHIFAPRALSATQVMSCTDACDGSGECIPIASAELHSKLFNLINNWQPGQGVSKAQLVTAVGAASDECKRSDSVIDKSGHIANTAKDPCAFEFETAGEKSHLTLPKTVDGQLNSASDGRRALFSRTNEALQLELPGDMSAYNGPLSEVTAPTNRTAIDFRTPTMCFRVTQH
jgi:hypothetical protein